jgi:hypothetical protein
LLEISKPSGVGGGMATKIDEQPHAKRSGRLKNGNPSGDFTKAPRCNAKTRRATPCRSPAMKNGRCRMHGGRSTGPRTREGRERSRQANIKHGYYSAEALAERRKANQVISDAKRLAQEIIQKQE